jgi:hypothetical protein
MDEKLDLFYHALNYRGAATQHAEELWQELKMCVNKLIEAEREACAKVCEEHIAEQVRAGIQPNYKQAAKNCAKLIRKRSQLMSF